MRYNPEFLKKISIIFLILFYCGTSKLCATSESEKSVSSFMEAEISSSGYEGECLVYDIFLYSTSDEISNITTIKNPDFGSLTTFKGTVSNVGAQKIKKKGKLYNKWNVAKYFVESGEKGTFKINGGEYEIFLPYVVFVDDPWWGRRRSTKYDRLKLSVPEVSFKVKPIPLSSAPKDFSGAIGDFSVISWLPPGIIAKDREAVAIIKVSGYGILSNIEFPGLKSVFTGDSRLKEIDRRENITQKDGKLYSEILFECSFIPIKEKGETNEFEFTFFNPATGKFKTVKTEPQPWNNEDEYTPVDKSKLKIIEI